MDSIPRFSIIVPHAPEREVEVLQSLKELNYPEGGYEVIIKPGRNPSRSRNEGIEESRGEYLAFIDDDCSADRDWLKRAEVLLKGADIVGGPNLTPPDDSFFSRISGYVLSSFFGTYKMSDRFKKGKAKANAEEVDLTSANCFIKKKVLEKIDGFDERLFPNEENELLHRAKKAGFKIMYSPDLIVYHRRRSTLPSFARQIFSSGRGRALQRKISGEGFTFIFFAPSLFVLYLILLPALFLLNKIFLLPVLAYISLSVIASIYESVKNRDLLALPFLPFLFLILHTSYGLGMLSGMTLKV